MNHLLKLSKQYISTGSFLALSAVTYLFSDTNTYAQAFIDSALPINGRFLAFATLLGLVFTYELSLKNSTANKKDSIRVKEQLTNLELLIEKRHLIADTNAAYIEFKNSKRQKITGEYYIKEILDLRDTRERLRVNSFTQRKIEFLVSRIDHEGETL